MKSSIQQLNKMVVAKKFIIEEYFDGPPKQSDLKMVEETLPPIKQGEFLAEAVYLSVDPYMRAYVYMSPLGSTMVAAQVAKIIESKNEDFPVGKYVVGKYHWQTHFISKGEKVKNDPTGQSPYIISNFGDLPLSLALGILGTGGVTAYFGFLDICKPKAGETVAISGAAGAVGSIVGQIAKIKGCNVIGITGSEEKGKYLIDNFGFDKCVNYKSKTFDEDLSKAAKNGIDCYFDNVAGEISTTIMKYMNMNGRISVCGSISSYNTDVNNPPKVSSVQLYMLHKQLIMEGFQQYLFEERKFEGINQLQQWIQEKKMKYVETVTEGFENMPKAFIEMMEGKNIGKAIVKV